MSVNISDSVTSIGSNAFSSCISLMSINIPSSVTSIGHAAFSECTSLTQIDVDQNNTTFLSIDGVLFNDITKILVAYPAGRFGTYTYTIPDGVSSIGNAAFSSCSELMSISIPDSVTSIGDNAFSRCTSLTSITIPEGVTSIGAYAFMRTPIKTIMLPSSIKSFGYGSFYLMSELENIVFMQGLLVIPDNVFSLLPNKVNIFIPKSVEHISKNSGLGTNITTTVYAFAKSAAEEYAKVNDIPYRVLPTILTEPYMPPIGYVNLPYSFKFQSTEGAELEVVKENLPPGMFVSTVSDAVHQLGEVYGTPHEPGVFEVTVRATDGNSYPLIDMITFTIVIEDEQIALPTSITISPTELQLNVNEEIQLIATILPSNAMNRTITWTSNNTAVATVSSAGLLTANATGKATITAETVNGLKATCAVTVASIIFLSASGTLTQAEVDAQLAYAGIGPNDSFSAAIDSSVTSIGERAFYDRTGLTSILIPEGLTSIGDSAFLHCNSLTSINIPDSVMSIGDGAFTYCLSLTDAVIGNGVTNIENNAFHGCTSLTNVIIGNSVTKIGDSAFAETALTNINIPSSVTNIGYSAFKLTRIQTITLPPLVRTFNMIIGWGVPAGPFFGMFDLDEIVFTQGSEMIAANAFIGIPNNVNIYVPKSVKRINENSGLNSMTTVFSFAETYAMEYAISKSIPYRTLPTILPEIPMPPIGYVNLPYSFKFQSSDCAGLEVVKEDLPPGMFISTVSAAGHQLGEIYGTPHEPGAFEVTVRATDGNSYPLVDEITFTIVINDKQTVLPTNITVSPAEMTLNVNENGQLVATILPEEAANSPLTWICSDTSIATVDANGNVTALAPGQTKITAKADNGVYGTCLVTVSNKSAIIKYVILHPSMQTLDVGANFRLTAVLLPDEAAGHPLTWSSSDTSIATVDDFGNVTAVAPGRAVIVANASNNVYGTGLITVNNLGSVTEQV